MKSLILGIIALTFISGFNLASAEENTPEFPSIIDLDPRVERELKCLAQNVYHEAGSESFNGKVAVAMVTINRASDGRFPGSICGVVKQKTHWRGSTVCQFSWFCSPKAHQAPPVESSNYQESLSAARKVLLEGFSISNLENALYFHARHVSPDWGKTIVARIGNHVFYSDQKSVRKIKKVEHKHVRKSKKH